MSNTHELKEALTTGEMPAAAGQEEKRLSWAEILADKEYRACYDRAVQDIVRRRLKNREVAEQKLLRLGPLLHALAERYGVSEEPECMDCEALAELIMEGAQQAAGDIERACLHLDGLMAQAEEFRADFPDFELDSALGDEKFLRLTAPHTGLSLADAYYALHRDEIGRRAAEESLEKLSRSILSGAARPREFGAEQSAHGFGPDPRRMTKSEREALKKRIYDAGALGERIYP